MGFYLIGPLVTLIPLGSISSWAFKPYCDDGLLAYHKQVSGAFATNGLQEWAPTRIEILAILYVVSI
jgi:hypothetical protein